LRWPGSSAATCRSGRRAQAKPHTARISSTPAIMRRSGRNPSRLRHRPIGGRRSKSSRTPGFIG
jgi:hypothetical protein